jgi:hypothetical protein
MKMTFIAIGIILVFVFVGFGIFFYKNGDSTIITPIISMTEGTQFEMSVGNKISIGNLNITLKEVSEDSRCPKNVECFWSGQVITKLEIEGKEGKEIVSLSSIREPMLIQKSSYVVKITNVLPEKIDEKGINQKNYKIVLSVNPFLEKESVK